MASFPTDRFCSRPCSDELWFSGVGADAGVDACPGCGEVFFSAGFAVLCSGAAGWVAEGVDSPPGLVPKLEKFHLPSGLRRSATWGFVSVILRTSSVFEKTSGSTLTPTFSACAWMKGVLLKEGSSAIEMLSAARLPDQSDNLRFPTVTWRPRALVSSDSIRGRKVFTLITKGRMMTMMIRIAMMIAIHLRTDFMAEPPPQLAVG